MKKTVKILALTLALVLCTLALVSCSTFPSIQKSFENNGYELQGEGKTGSFSYEGKEISYTVYTFQLKKAEEDGGLLDNIIGGITQTLSTAIVWEFATNADLQKAIESSEEIKTVLKDAETSDYVNGNCVLMTVNPDAVKIFNGETLD